MPTSKNSIFRSLTRFTRTEISNFFRSVNFVYQSTDLKFIFAPKQDDFSKILVIASKKYGNAPKRNKFKRRLKNIFFNKKYYELNSDIAVKPLNKKTSSYHDLENQIDIAIKKFLKLKVTA